MQNLTAAELTQRLYSHIPLSRAMGVKVIQAEESCAILSAPLQPNINHQGTVFGGSINTLAILAAYSLLYLRLSRSHPECHIVIQQNTLQYERPLAGDMLAQCQLDDSVNWPCFMRTLERHGRARISLASVVMHDEQRCASFKGDFVAWCR